MNPYLIGTDCLGVDMIPKVAPEGGYTDYGTVLAVQTALRMRGFDPGKLDGVFGPKTSAAVKAMQASIGAVQTGVIDEGVVSALGVPVGGYPDGVPPAKHSVPIATPPAASGSYAQVVPRPTVQSPAATTGFWGQPAWQGAPVKRWQGALGGVGLAALLGGLVWIGVKR